jgi:membrane-associated phospholipid phosphatase
VNDQRRAVARALDPRPSDPSVQGELERDRYVGRTDLTRWPTRFGQLLVHLAHGISDRLGAYSALVVTLVIGIGIAAGLTFAFGWVYDAVTEKDGVAGLDMPLLQLARSLRNPFVNAAVTDYTNIGGTTLMPILAAAVAILLSALRRSWTPLILMLAASGGSLAMTIAGKRLFGRLRPEHRFAVPPFETSPSFPSGHTLNAFVIAGIVAYILILRQRRTWARVLTITVAALFALTIGLSRVFLGHHWFTDVLAGWIIGAAWLAFVITTHRLYLTVQRRRAEHRSPSEVPATPGLA